MERSTTLKIRVPSGRDDEWLIYVFELKFSSFTTVVGDRWYKCKINPYYYLLRIRPFEVSVLGKEKLCDTSLLDIAVKVEVFQDKLRVDFCPYGDISVPFDVRGIGLGSYIYGRLIEMVKEDLKGEERPIEVFNLKLSSVDAQDKENFHRRTNFYRGLGFYVRIDEKGDGEAYTHDLFSLGYVPPPNKYEEVSAGLEEVVRSIKEKLGAKEEKYRKEIEDLLLARIEPEWKKDIKALLYLVQELLSSLVRTARFVLLLPIGALLHLRYRWKLRRRRF